MPVPSRALVALLLSAAIAASAGPLLRPVAAHPASARSLGARPSPSASPSAGPTPTPSVMPAPTTSSTPKPTRRPTSTPSRTPAGATAPSAGTYQWAGTEGAVLGAAGTLRRYRVAVENGVGVAVTDFAGAVDATLGDPRSWIAGNNVRLQRVPGTAAANFTVYLASPATAYRLCRAGGVDIRVGGTPYTSCRVGASVVINSARWLNSVPDYGASLSAYRQYVINHEVGHWLGHGHELCPGDGRLAPVMEQQTLSLAGCVANSWPYVDGVRYAGPPGSL